MIVTQWFAPDIKPKHVGVYQTADGHALNDIHHIYQYWNGKQWGVCELDPQSAERDKHIFSVFQVNYWRGLAEKPKAKK